MYRNAILSLAAAIAVGAVATTTDARDRLDAPWYSLLQQQKLRADAPSTATIMFPCGRQMYQGGDRKCYPMLS